VTDLDDTSDASLYMIDDTVADMGNTLYQASPPLILVTLSATPLPRPTGTPTSFTVAGHHRGWSTRGRDPSISGA
jgi:hypothetical protein